MALDQNIIIQLWRKTDAHVSNTTNLLVRHPDQTDHLAQIDHAKQVVLELRCALSAAQEIERRLVLS